VRTGRVARDSTADIDMAALTERSIATIEGESDGESAAAHTLALVLATRRRLPLLPRKRGASNVLTGGRDLQTAVWS